MKKDWLSEVYLEDTFVNDEYDETTFYFTSSKEMLKSLLPHKDYPEAVSMCLSVEIPTSTMSIKDAIIEVSPTMEWYGQLNDYDWNEIELPRKDIEALIAMATN